MGRSDAEGELTEGQVGMKSWVSVGTVLCAVALAATTTVGYAQTAPPGAAAPVPVLPTSPTPPPNTTIPASLSDIPTQSVNFSYFGPYSTVTQFTLPPVVRANSPVGCWSAPNATPQDQVGAVNFGTKPAGSEFIAFFARGTRLYVFDTSTGNYCWIDNDVSRA
jgi:hypothetical protein